MDGYGREEERRRVPYAFDPTEGMTPEERLGFELISSLEGRLVTDDTFRAYTRSLGKTIRTMKRQVLWTRGIASTLLMVSIGLGAWAINEADVASQIAACNEYRIKAFANPAVVEVAERAGCDMRATRVLIERGKARDAEIKRLAESLAPK